MGRYLARFALPTSEVEAILAFMTQETDRNLITMSRRAEPVVNYIIDLKFNDGKVQIALREDKGGFKILSMRSSPQRKGLGRKALQFLKGKGIVGRPVNIMHKADEFWVKMHSEGLVKRPYRRAK